MRKIKASIWEKKLSAIIEVSAREHKNRSRSEDFNSKRDNDNGFLKKIKKIVDLLFYIQQHCYWQYTIPKTYPRYWLQNIVSQVARTVVLIISSAANKFQILPSSVCDTRPRSPSVPPLILQQSPNNSPILWQIIHFGVIQLFSVIIQNILSIF